MYWKVKCDCCNEEFETNTLGQTICPNCISEKNQIEMTDKINESWQKLGKKEMVPIGINFYFDRGFVDGYRHYNAMYVTEIAIPNATYAKLDFQCQCLRFFDENDIELLTTTTPCYDNGENIETLIIFEDEDGYNVI